MAELSRIGRAVKKIPNTAVISRGFGNHPDGWFHGARVAYHHHLRRYLAACHRSLVPSAFFEGRCEGNRDIMLYATSTISNRVIAALGPRAVGATYEPHSTSN